MNAIFGDSHIRSLSYISKDSTFYLGRGRDFRHLNYLTIFKLSFRIFILNLFIGSYDCRILSFSEPFFRDLLYLDDSVRNKKLSFFFSRLHLLFKILSLINCKPTHFLLPHSPNFSIHTFVVNCLPRFESLLTQYSIIPLFVGDNMFDHNCALIKDYLGYEFTNPSNPDKVHAGPYLGITISERFSIQPNSSDYISLPMFNNNTFLISLFDYFFLWNPLFSCYRYQTFLLKLLRLKLNLTKLFLS